MSASRNADWLDRKLFPYTQKRLELDGHELPYVDEGKGPPLLMLHGNPTWSFL
jgi:haloalkane dehalogenase